VTGLLSQMRLEEVTKYAVYLIKNALLPQIAVDETLLAML